MIKKAGFNKFSWLHWFFFLSGSIIYFLLAYYIPRSAGLPLFVCYGFLFVSYLWIYKNSPKEIVGGLLLLSILLRLLWLPALPQLSDDFYRFIWDGRLLANGTNPFAFTPQQLYQQGLLHNLGLNTEIFDKLNSPRYFTIYPPINQAIFYIAAKLSPNSIIGSVIIMRIFIILAEIGNVFLLSRMVKIKKLPPQSVILYAFNPLVIIELTGNLHFEAIMIFFLLLAVYSWQRKNAFTGGVMMAFSIATKLLPLMLLPLWLGRLSWRKLLLFYFAAAISLFLLFSFLLDYAFLQGIQSSLSLYFQKFEFNASLYYIIREIGYWCKGYNIIQTAGRYLALFVVIFIAFMSWWQHRRNLSIWHAIIWVWLGYLLLATTVHPWYVTPLLAISVFTHYRFAYLWSSLIFFTYVNYQPSGYQENLWVVMAEYLILLSFIIYEVFKKKVLQH